MLKKSYVQSVLSMDELPESACKLLYLYHASWKKGRPLQG
jgi:hypothetical protein